METDASQAWTWECHDCGASAEISTEEEARQLRLCPGRHNVVNGTSIHPPSMDLEKLAQEIRRFYGGLL